MQAVMSEPSTTAESILKELAVMLASPQLPVQERIAKDLGVDQPFVSNARNGKLKRVTPRVIRLREYASMRIDAAAAAKSAAEEIDAEVESTSSTARRRPESRVPSSSAVRRYDDDAIAGVKAYLQDGYDARLIVEQLAVLRRAQRVRIPGRSASGDEPA